MTKEEFIDMIQQIVHRGIDVTMKMSEGVLMYDLNTEMKSHLMLHYDTNKEQCDFYGRYGTEGTIEDYRGLLWEVKDCLHGQDFGNQAWLDLLVEEGVLEIITTTTRSFK
jgi:hypothetical protein